MDDEKRREALGLAEERGDTRAGERANESSSGERHKQVNTAVGGNRGLSPITTALANGRKAANGFEALRELDTNKDGKVDANDAAYASLRIWKDADSDGITDAGELLTLAEAGVKSLNTGYANQSLTDAQGNTRTHLDSHTRTDGSTWQMDEYQGQISKAGWQSIGRPDIFAKKDMHWRQAA